MKAEIEKLKGIHPGKIIGRDLRRLGISQRSFAAAIGEHSQTLNAVISGRRNLTTEMAVKIEEYMGYEEGFLLILQAFHSIAVYRDRLASLSVSSHPDVRRSLFWDTDFDKIDWGKYKTSVIQRIIEKGNESEQAEIARFYNISLNDLKNFTPANSYRIKR